MVERAEALYRLVAPLAVADAEAYAKVLEALRLPPASAAREAELEAALSRAADVPLAVAEAASEVATLAALAAQAGTAPLRGDAVVAAAIAEAGARGAAELVAINLGHRDDARVRRAAADALSRAPYAPSVAALGRILAFTRPAGQWTERILNARSTKRGTSLAQMQALALDLATTAPYVARISARILVCLVSAPLSWLTAKHSAFFAL